MTVKGEKSTQIIEYILKNLIDKNLISENQKEQIKERLLKRESLGKIVLPNKGFVIYHCTIENIDFPLVVVGKVIEEVKMKNLVGDYEKIRTAFLMVAPEGDREGIEVLGDLSMSLIEREDLVNTLNEAQSQKEVKEKIKEVLLKKFYEEIKRII
ncbi:hypothetical protein Teth39_1701 [Thermoanaerobacter pseudethanolicus ATCC 33223]|uniref:PTS EIIA type-2 domain-containing protein n=2 Tax=Thermoanaerobacter TaxID=1754 RepID=B0KBP3_THEP3|nr:hypothetical protein Teth39_1701 [Thermoanaerobacter pseudethanolicus ATCC 33223]